MRNLSWCEPKKREIHRTKNVRCKTVSRFARNDGDVDSLSACRRTIEIRRGYFSGGSSWDGW